jgi:GntR family transcriptional regulator
MIDFKLDPKSGVPYYKQIIDQIRFGIASGKLQTGEQLPTVRSLAVNLKINLNTVSKAYKELEIRDVLVTEQGSGTFIGGDSVKSVSNDERKKKLNSICEEFLGITSTYGYTLNEVIENLKNKKES